MQGWLESVVGPDYAAALMWTIVALIVLLVLLVSIRIVRGFSTGTFISGGRNRKTRLAVMDATAVDSHRRLILVRRDDVEHLLLIGGPTDVVVEQNIRLVQAARRQADELAYSQGHGYAAETPAEQPRPHHQPEPAPRQAPPSVAPQPQRPVHVAAPVVAAPPPAQPAPASPAPAARTEPRFSQHLPSSPTTPPRPAPYAPPAPSTAAPGVQPARPAVTPVHAAPAPAPAVAPAKPDLDEALLRELEVSLDKEPATAPAPAPQVAPQPAAKSAVDSTLDEEMSRLLSDLAGKR